MAEQNLFKEIELGVRELFRIIIPGAYVVSLTHVIAPEASFSQMMTKTAASGLAASFFLGLVGYALRAHECWFPYFFHFEQQRVKLNSEIARITGLSEKEDNVGSYKYFLETAAEALSDRIHYFSSFYYMLAELSLFSIAAAYSIVFLFLFRIVRPVSSTGIGMSLVLLISAFAVQLAVLSDVASVRRRLAKFGLIATAAVVVVALLVLFLIACCTGALSFHDFFQSVGFTALVLSIISYLFWRLGDKHWKQIIGEQIVLVNVKAAGLIEASKKYKASPMP